MSLYRETKCEHGKHFSHELAHVVAASDLCSGGSREEVVINYEFAAIIQHNRNMYEPMWVIWTDLSEGDRVNRIKQAKIDVDAALSVPEDDE